jgi:thymidylate synthase (FAD)
MDPTRIVTEPRVYLVGKSHLDSDMLKAFLDDEGMIFETDTNVDAEILAEAAGRVCYLSFGKGRKSNAEYLENIIASHHGSVLEHVTWSFIITGISRSLTHELIRHRVGFAYSQESQRFVDESDTRYVLPPLLQERPELKAKWEQAIDAAHQSYCALVEETERYVAERYPELEGTDRRKLVRQSARSVLPNACETKLFVTANARAWRHFVEMRGSIHADAEIRILAVAVAKILKEEAPHIFGDIDIILDHGVEVTRTKHSKV